MVGLLIFIFGLAIGSFLNVLIIRLPQPEISKYRNIVGGYSRCPKCQKMISWYENIPVLSFLFLRGRCRHCRSSISWQYPIVELLTGFLFLFSFLIYGNHPVFLVYVLFLISLLIVIAFIDLKHLLILDSLILAGFIVSLLFIFLASSFQLPASSLQTPASNFYGLLFFGGILLFLFLITKGRGIGLGDVKMAGWLGFVFGFENSINIFYLTFFIGFIWAIILLVSKKAGLKSKVPLGSLMALASVLFLLSGFNPLDFINSELILRLWLN